MGHINNTTFPFLSHCLKFARPSCIEKSVLQFFALASTHASENLKWCILSEVWIIYYKTTCHVPTNSPTEVAEHWGRPFRFVAPVYKINANYTHTHTQVKNLRNLKPNTKMKQSLKVSKDYVPQNSNYILETFHGPKFFRPQNFSYRLSLLHQRRRHILVHPQEPVYTKCDVQLIKVAPYDGLIQSETCRASNGK